MLYVILALGIYLFMLIHSYKCYKNIECLSDIAYDKHSWIFPICLIGIATLLFIGMFTSTVFPINWFCLIPAIAMIIVALTPYKDSLLKYKIHYISSLIAFISILILWILKGYWFIPILFCLASLRSKWLLGLEMGLLGSSFLYLLI